VGGGGGWGGGGGGGGLMVYGSESSQNTVTVDSKSNDALFGKNVCYVFVTMLIVSFSPVFL